MPVLESGEDDTNTQEVLTGANAMDLGGYGIKCNMQPPNLNKFKCYEDFVDRVELWECTTDIPTSKLGLLLANSLPDESRKYGDNLATALLKKYKAKDLAKPNGLKLVMEWLDAKLGQTKILSEITAFADIYRYRRESNQSIVQYTDEFDLRYNKCIAAGIKLPTSVVAFMLLLGAELDNTQYLHIKGAIDVAKESKDDNLYEKIKVKMVELLTDSLGKVSGEPTKSFKQEEMAFLAENEEAFANWKAKKNGWKNDWKSSGKQKWNDHKSNSNKPKDTNPVDRNGDTTRCRGCGAWNHYIKECPSRNKQAKTFTKFKSKNGKQVYLVQANTSDEDSEEEESEIVKVVMFTTDKAELNRFTFESLNCAALDTCCTSTVAGKKWFEIYLDEMPDNMKKMVKGPFKSGKTFMFGNEGKLTSDLAYTIPIKICGKYAMIQVDVIKSDIPLLLSKAEMSSQGMVLDMKNDAAYVNGKPLKVSTTSAGHFIMDLLEQEETSSLEDIFVVDLLNADAETQLKTIEKLHKQFGHRPKRIFIDLLKNNNQWQPHFSQMLDKIIDSCEGCILRKRNPDRPAVALPRTNDFNDILTMDLKIWHGKNILYMIDMFSRFTVATVITRKTPGDVIDAVFKHWIRYFGIPNRVWTDNGGEFTGEEMREVTSILNVYKDTTAAEAPWMNGLNEKNHALADNILKQVMRDYPDISLESALAWTCSAKNSLSMVYGYSPYQLVFGKNPRLPNILNDPPPSWAIEPKSKALVKQLRALHATREAFIKAEACEKLKIALKSKIRTIDRVYQPGDYAFYRRERDEEFRGPAKVVCQDGKIIWLRHGSYCVKVSVNRLLPVKDELAASYRQEEETEDKENKLGHDSKDVSDNTVNDNQTEDKDSASNVTISSSGQSEEELHQESRITDANKEVSESGEDSTDCAQNEHASGDMQEQVEFDDSAAQQSDNAEEEHEDNEPTPIIIRKNDRVEVKITPESDWERGMITKRAGKVKHWPNHWNFRLDNGKEFSADITELELRKLPAEEALAAYTHEHILAVMIPKDRQNTEECMEAKQAELQKLIDFDTYETVDDEGQQHITCTWVMTQKGKEARARLTARGFQEQEKFPSDSPTLRKSSLRTALAIAAAKGWKITATDIKSAFLQGSHLQRDVYVKPPKEANQKGKLWKLLKCLYGLKDASRAWYKKVEDQLENEGFEMSKYDSGLFFMCKDKELIGMVGLHVDDFISAGTVEFSTTVMKKILSVFKVGKSETDSFLYTGFQIHQSDNCITLDQKEYVSKIEIPILPAERMLMKEADMTEEELTTHRRMVGSINWVVRATRPDLSFDMIFLSTKFKGGKVEDLKQARKVLTNIVHNDAVIRLSSVGDLKTAEIWLYTDASLGNLNHGVDSTGSYIILLVNTVTGKCAPLDWKSNKIKRVVVSTIAAETLSLSAGLDKAVSIRRNMQDMLGIKYDLPIRALVDNKSTVDAMHSTGTTTETRLMREVASVKELLKKKKIKELTWVPTNLMLADALTKKGVNSLNLMKVMQNGNLDSEFLSSVLSR